jgi:hypothetical protein
MRWNVLTLELVMMIGGMGTFTSRMDFTFYDGAC